MRSNYNKLWEYIREVNIRNKDLNINNLIWVSMEKRFISSVANMVDVDISVYKIIEKWQFACKLMSVWRDEKLPVDLYRSDKKAIVSSAYYVFEIIDKNILLDDYLLMWLSRPENDRYIGYISGWDVRWWISWETFCDIPIKVPDITKQQEIIDEYNTIKDRITLNNSLIEKLEETAQAVYREWFVDFEFPDENGNPYKSSGWEIEFCEELEKEVPKGWKYESLWTFFPVITWKKDANIATTDWIYPFFTCSRDIFYTDDYSFDSSSILLTWNWDYNVKWYEWKFEAYQRTYVLTPYDKDLIWFLFFSIQYFLQDITNWDRWSVISFITKWMIEDYKIIVPESELLTELAHKFNTLNNNIAIIKKENENLWKMKDLILSKMASEG